MAYFAEFVGSLIFLLGGYAYMCNVSLKKTLVSSLNYIELVVAWSLAVGFGLAIAVIMGGPAYLNPGVVLGNLIYNGLGITDALMYLLMEFLAAGAAMLICTHVRINFRLHHTDTKFLLQMLNGSARF